MLGASRQSREGEAHRVAVGHEKQLVPHGDDSPEQADRVQPAPELQPQAVLHPDAVQQLQPEQPGVHVVRRVLHEQREAADLPVRTMIAGIFGKTQPRIQQ